MKKQISKWLTILVPLFIGIGIIYYQYTTLSKEELNNIVTSFKKANYYYIFLSLIISCIGYWSRAYRWKFSLNYLGYQTKFSSNFLTVCISYFVNLTVPRSGEISRAALIKKYENVPFDKALGTIVAERIIDFLIFLLFVVIGVILQFEKLHQLLLSKKIAPQIFFIIGFLGISALVAFILLWKFSKWKIFLKLKNKLAGLVEGLTTVFKMNTKWYYLFHSFFIWFAYLMMFYVAIFALPETSKISFDIVIMGFIFGSLAVGFSSGGLGAYPLSIAIIFSLYGITKDVGTAFGWLVWTSQTVLAILFGVISYLLLPLLNRKK